MEELYKSDNIYYKLSFTTEFEDFYVQQIDMMLN